MNWFSERDVRRHYDLLQHTEDRDVTAILVADDDHIIGLGLFDNEDDFVSECARYNRNGVVYVGVNPRRARLLNDYGGLKNCVRTLFSDISGPEDIEYVTGVAVPGSMDLSPEMKRFAKDASVLSDGQTLFALDEALAISDAETGERNLQSLITASSGWAYRLLQYVPVVGTALAKPSFLKRRFGFRRYRPYFIPGLRDYLSADAK